MLYGGIGLGRREKPSVPKLGGKGENPWGTSQKAQGEGERRDKGRNGPVTGGMAKANPKRLNQNAFDSQNLQARRKAKGEEVRGGWEERGRSGQGVLAGRPGGSHSRERGSRGFEDAREEGEALAARVTGQVGDLKYHGNVCRLEVPNPLDSDFLCGFKQLGEAATCAGEGEGPEKRGEVPRAVFLQGAGGRSGQDLCRLPKEVVCWMAEPCHGVEHHREVLRTERADLGGGCSRSCIQEGRRRQPEAREGPSEAG